MDGSLDALPVAEAEQFLDRLTGLENFIHPELIEQVLMETGRLPQRNCQLDSRVMIWLVLAMGIHTHLPIRSVFRNCRRFSKETPIPSRSALCKARQRLGLAPLKSLFRKVVSPVCRPEVKGGFYAGLQLMGIDGVSFTTPATSANIRAFGLPQGGHTAESQGGYPLVSKVSLVELGSHVELGFTIRSQRQGEATLARRLMRHLCPGMLLLLDAGFFGYPLLRSIMATGAQFLVNVKKGPLLKPSKVLPDGSYLSKIYACTRDRERDENGRIVRVIEYRLNDPQRPNYGQVRRLVTSLLDHEAHPAITLIELYHERWEHEGVNDEQKTHQDPRRPTKPTHLRSESPAGVIQELYALSLAHFVVRKTMFEAAAVGPLDPDRVSFTGAFQILQTRLPECPPHPTPFALRNWYENLILETSQELVEPRRNRINPRVIKRARCKWPSKKPEHYNQPKLQKVFREAILVL